MKQPPRGKRREGLQARTKRLEREAVAHRKSARELEGYQEAFRVQNEQLVESQRLLETSRDRYVDLFDLAPIGYALLDEHGLIVDINLTAALLIGKERSRLLGVPFRNCVIPEQRRAFLDHLKSSWTANTTVSVKLGLKQVKGERTCELHSRRTPFESTRSDMARQILTAIVDITERVRLEQTVVTSEGRSHLALSAAGAATWEWEPATKVLSWSKQHFHLLGISESITPTFAAWQRCADPADRAQLEVLGRAELLTAEIDIEYRVRRTSGAIHWLRTMGKTVRSPQGMPKAFGITLDITTLKVIESRLIQLNAALEDRTAEAEARATQLRSVIAQLARAETREQARLAEILHDHVQQVLVAADLKLAQLMRKAKGADVGASLAQVSEFVREALQRTSLLSRDYNPRILEEAGLLQALHWQASAMKEEYGLLVRVERLTEIEPAEHEVRVILFRAVKELLFNVVKHAKTTRARVRVSKNGEMIEIEVSDGGAGFDVHKETADPTPDGAGGQGLPRIRDRVLALGGQFRVESIEGAGTRARLSVPVRPALRAPSPATNDEFDVTPTSKLAREIAASSAETRSDSAEGTARAARGRRRRRRGSETDAKRERLET